MDSPRPDHADPDLTREVFIQHWEHARHVESERLAITGAYVALVAGMLTYFGTKADFDEDAFPILLFLCVVSLVGLGFCMKIYSIFEAHVNAAEIILKQYHAPSMTQIVNALPIAKHRWIGVGALFAKIYCVGLAFSGYFALISIECPLWGAIVAAVLSFIVSYAWSRRMTAPERNEA